jgi:hypothetical protein
VCLLRNVSNVSFSFFFVGSRTAGLDLTKPGFIKCGKCFYCFFLIEKRFLRFFYFFFVGSQNAGLDLTKPGFIK